MPLARTALYMEGVELYLAPTADSRDTWQATLQHIACKGRCFVLGCNQFVTKDMYPADLEMLDELSDQPQTLCRGGSAIISPMGEYLAGPLFDQEGMLLAELDLGEVVRAKFDLDVVGHYARPDVFQLEVKRSLTRQALCDVQDGNRAISGPQEPPAVPPKAVTSGPGEGDVRC